MSEIDDIRRENAKLYGAVQKAMASNAAMLHALGALRRHTDRTVDALEVLRSDVLTCHDGVAVFDTVRHFAEAFTASSETVTQEMEAAR